MDKDFVTLLRTESKSFTAELLRFHKDPDPFSPSKMASLEARIRSLKGLSPVKAEDRVGTTKEESSPGGPPFLKAEEPSVVNPPAYEGKGREGDEENVTPFGKEELSPTKETPASVEQGSEIRAPVVFEARSGKGRESYRAETKGEAGEDAVKEKTPVPDEKVEAVLGNTPVPDDKKGEILIFGEDAEREDSGTDEDLEMGVVQVVSEEKEDENEVADGQCGAKVEQGDIILSSPLLQSQDPCVPDPTVLRKISIPASVSTGAKVC
ncbi:hypothetical protein U1Q18_003351 [Sarracenia purpurea var. burkii]